LKVWAEDPSLGWVEIWKMERRMSPRCLLLTLLAAFGLAVLFATLTTVRQLHIQTSAITQPLQRS
jgi:hypothetical protein